MSTATAKKASCLLAVDIIGMTAKHNPYSIQPVSKVLKVGNRINPFITIFMPPQVELHSTGATSERKLPSHQLHVST